ncbi:protein glutamate methyltransferase CheR associated with MCPs of class 34H [Citrifermentans bemidjiense Bem]|uniref:protein-glutamate O-methyltransferase n=1 Tax=Citrifermentans bemidjiense (strain ATCC BAA-1014 / DSM 16622 / JCM 12645 / Bem) TaxID=404380 RepID=B5E8M8_CITBB|nr:protein-glutamate O-methyltransferase [Citrifermentans bemidjiense]ACH38613.2 protein glutamate methyltransferase CheR associated with MCPs of class 34H [Citrifermentans bemidjiense Bem]
MFASGALRMEEPGRIDHTAVLSARDFGRLSRFIYDTCGIKMPDVKKTMLEARLQKRLRALGIHSFTDYCDYLFSNEGLEKELVQMLDMVTTNKTDFFREPDHFNYLSHTVLPDWVRKHPGATLAIWSAGCSSGEEPYTLAMVLSEFALNNPGFDFRILATDISTRVLEKAKNAIYQESQVEPVPFELKKKYLLRSKDRSSGMVRIVPELREKVRFRRLNFMDEDFGMREHLDIIFCRNVIIYFDRPTQEKLLQRFHRNMKPGAFIFMGHSETLSGLDVPLVSVYPTVYRRQK